MVAGRIVGRFEHAVGNGDIVLASGFGRDSPAATSDGESGDVSETQVLHRYLSEQMQLLGRIVALLGKTQRRIERRAGYSRCCDRSISTSGQLAHGF
jgi:hypothetical protein